MLRIGRIIYGNDGENPGRRGERVPKNPYQHNYSYGCPIVYLLGIAVLNVSVSIYLFGRIPDEKVPIHGDGS